MVFKNAIQCLRKVTSKTESQQNITLENELAKNHRNITICQNIYTITNESICLPSPKQQKILEDGKLIVEVKTCDERTHKCAVFLFRCQAAI